MIVRTNIVEKYTIMHKYIKDIFEKSVYLDIETTGLSWQTSNIISITLLLAGNSQQCIYQLFACNENDEKELLEYFINLIKNKNYAITYNGNTFDLNYLNNKIKYYNLNFDILSLSSIDLYKDVKVVRSKLSIENMKLKTMEKFFGIKRIDTLTGKEIVKLYQSYQIHNKSEHMELILAHNYEDVLYLPILFDNILDLYDKIIYSPFGLIKLISKNICISDKLIKVKISDITDIKYNYSGNSAAYSVIYNKSISTMTIEIFVYLYSDTSGNKLIYANNYELNIPKFKTNKSLQENIIPIVINDNIVFDNVYYIVEKIVMSI